MQFLANENFPGVAVSALIAAGHDVVWIRTAAPGTKRLGRVFLRARARTCPHASVAITSSALTGPSLRRRQPLPRGHPVRALEPPRHVTLIGETRLCRSGCQR